MHANWLIKALLGFLFGSLILIAGLLVAEYRYFKNQSEKMVVLQTEYKNYVLALRHLLRGSQLLQGPASASGEKKNEQASNNFIIVNRSNESLKESSLAFFKRFHLQKTENQIDPSEWLDYTQVALNQKKSDPVHTAQKKRKRQRSKRSSIRIRIARRARTSHTILWSQKSNTNFLWPIDPRHFWVSSLFGPRKNPSGWGFHRGLDMAAVKGTPVRAAASGQVVEVRHDVHGYGKMILLEHTNRYQTRYAHLDKIFVQPGQQIERGSIIGRVGATGNVRSMGFDGSHLHFEVRVSGRTINPIYLLS